MQLCMTGLGLVLLRKSCGGLPTGQLVYQSFFSKIHMIRFITCSQNLIVKIVVMMDDFVYFQILQPPSDHLS